MAYEPFDPRVVPMPSGCWEWTGTRCAKNYGVVGINGRQFKAHRLAYEAAKGPIPEGLFVCHACDNPPCCNPNHLWVGNPADNAGDAKSKGRMRGQKLTHCLRGHPYDESNTYLTPRGGRYCKACARVAARKAYRNNREKILEKKKQRKRAS